MNGDVIATVIAADGAGLCVLPPAQDGSKVPIAPGAPWKRYQRERPSTEQLKSWYLGEGRAGISLVTGAVSNNLGALDFDCRATYDAFLVEADRAGLGELVERVRAGYEEDTPDDGVHLLYYCDEALPNTPLAKRPTRPEERHDEHDKSRPLIETRGEGGVVIVAPTNGRVHPTGGRYVLRRGGIGTIATITPGEQADLFDFARTFDQMPAPPPREPRPPGPATGDRPGDDFARRTDWAGILEPRGWAHVDRHGDEDYWRRPGKTQGVSATTNYRGSGVLKVFTSSTEFVQGATYSKFGAYTVLEHGGDFAAAARFLVSRGYGTPLARAEVSAPPGDPPTAPTVDTADPSPTLSDLGNARRLVRRHGHDLRYCHAWAKWLVWDGRRWRADDSGEVVRRAKETVGAIYQEAAKAGDDDERKALAKFALKSEAEARITAMVALAESEPGVAVRPDDLDRDPWLLNVANGTLDLRTGQLRPHARADRITKLVPVAYDDLAACPTWLAFLDRVLAGKADLVAFVRRAAGYSLTGTTSERALLILWGVGRNGKTTLLETVMAVLGDYALRTPTETLLAKRDGGIPNDVARLKGMRFVFASEAEEGRRLDEARVKDLTGGDTLSARFMRGEWFDFRPEFKLWLGTNHKPVIRGTDHAIWDRLRLIPFEVRIPESEQDKGLRDKLLAEAPGILAWAVAGCLDWQRDGLAAPKEVRSATDAYRTEQDVFGAFLADCCRFQPEATTTAKALYAAYQRWCEDNGEKPGSQQAIGRRLTERGLEQFRLTGGARAWRGIALIGGGEPNARELGLEVRA